MKTLKRNLTVTILSLTAILISTNSNAMINLNVTTNENSKTVRMELITPSSEAIDVYVLNKRDKKLYSDRIMVGSTYSSLYDFENFKTGTYTLVSELENMRLNRTIEVRESGAKVIDSYYTFSPTFKIQDSKVIVHYISDSNDKVDISIEGMDEFIYDGSYSSEENTFTRAYDINNLEEGFYTMNFISSGEFHSYEFEVK